MPQVGGGDKLLPGRGIVAPSSTTLCLQVAVSTPILSGERGRKKLSTPLLLGWEGLLLGPETEPCCITDSACD